MRKSYFLFNGCRNVTNSIHACNEYGMLLQLYFALSHNIDIFGFDIFIILSAHVYSTI